MNTIITMPEIGITMCVRFADGALSGAVIGVITGTACAGIGAAGQAFGNTLNAVRSHPEYNGMKIHEVHPVKFSGSPTDVNNKISLLPENHKMYTKFWAAIKAKALKN